MKRFKGYVLLSIVLVAVLLPGCKKREGNGTLVINLVPKYGNQYFVLDSPNTDRVGRNIKLDLFQFYLSHMYLVTTGNTLVKITDVGFFDLSQNTTLTIITNNLNGTFTGITFGCGLDSVMDKIRFVTDSTPPGLAAGLGPMFGPQMYTNTSINFQGNWDSTGVSGYPYGFFYHIVGYPYYRQTTVNNNFTVCCGKTTTKTLYIDIEKIFYNGNTQVLNLSTQGYTASGTSDSVVASLFATNFAAAFSLQ